MFNKFKQVYRSSTQLHVYPALAENDQKTIGFQIEIFNYLIYSGISWTLLIFVHPGVSRVPGWPGTSIPGANQ